MGIVFGLLSGWVFCMAYIVYASGFYFGILLGDDSNYNKSYVSKILSTILIIGRRITFFAYVTHFLQSVEQARSAITLVFRLIDD
ncbi:unnamed protein product, partial [Rotaria magnacalcarata]